MTKAEKKSSAWVIRWAAIGAAVAVTLGAGGLVGVDAASEGTSPAFIPVDPVRIWDSRTDVIDPEIDEGTQLFPGDIYQIDFEEILYNEITDDPAGYGVEYVVDAVVINVTIPGGTINNRGYVSVTPSICEVGDNTPQPVNPDCYENIYENPATADYTTQTLTSYVNWGDESPSTANMVTATLGEWGTEGSGQLDFLMPWTTPLIDPGDMGVADVVVDLVGFYSTGCPIDNCFG